MYIWVKTVLGLPIQLNSSLESKVKSWSLQKLHSQSAGPLIRQCETAPKLVVNGPVISRVTAQDFVTWLDGDAGRRAGWQQSWKLWDWGGDVDGAGGAREICCSSDRWRCASTCDESSRYTVRSRPGWWCCWCSTASILSTPESNVNTHKAHSLSSTNCENKYHYLFIVVLSVYIACRYQLQA